MYQPPEVTSPIEEEDGPKAPPVRPAGPIAPGVGDSSWPNVIGTLLCVFGGIGILQRVIGTIYTALMPVLPVPTSWKLTGSMWTWGLVLAIVSAPISFVHLWAGIQTLRRRPTARMWVMVLIVYAFAILVPNSVFGYFNAVQQMQASGQQGNAPAGFAAMNQGFVVIGIVIGVLIAIAWPTFLLIWFSVRSVRDEVRSWSAQPR